MRLSKKRNYPLHIFVSVGIIIVVLVASFVSIYVLRKKSQDDRGNASSNSTEFVSKIGTKFFWRGKVFQFVGFNLFDAANTYFPDTEKRGYSCPRDNGWWSDIYSPSDLDATFKYMKENAGASVVRFWAFQRYTDSGQDWSGIDKVIAIAKKYDVKVLPVLDDGPGYCTYPEPQGSAKWNYNGDTWYTDGYKIRQGNYKLTYPEYVKAIVTRYKDEPTIFAWMMMNEADTSMKVLADGSLKKDGNGPSVLVNFAKDIGSLIKGIDQNHLVTIGTQSNGASGATGRDFASVYALPQIDFAEVHDWGYWGAKETSDHKFPHDFRLGEQNPLPGSTDGISLPDPNSSNCQSFYEKAQIGCSIAISIQKLNKPIIVGESGISIKRWTISDRAKLLDAKMNAFFHVGGAGYLVWQINKVVDSEGFDVLTTTNDPLFGIMKKYASPIGIAPTQSPSPLVTIKPTILPTKLPTTTPKATSTSLPRPTVLPTPRMTTAPKAALQSIQGENLVLSNGATIVSDSQALYGKALLMNRNTTATGKIAGPIKRIDIQAKSLECAGYGHMIVKINGSYALDQNIYSSTYTSYKTTNLSYMNLKGNSYPIEITFNNQYVSTSCSRNIYIDEIQVLE